jgi:hypothetical protein
MTTEIAPMIDTKVPITLNWKLEHLHSTFDLLPEINCNIIKRVDDPWELGPKPFKCFLLLL